MNNKKKMVLGAAFVVAILALAGVGYAITDNFHGTTSSYERDADVDYVKVSLAAGDYSEETLPISTSLYWDSVTTSAGTQYTVRPGGVSLA
jgi:hypothetical protein